jgi:Sulfotransferase family
VVDAPVPLVALIGAPRSGTTWLQNLLGADPAVVSPQETSLFSRFVAPLDESWRWGMRGTDDDWARRRFIGLGAVLTEDEFTTLVRGFVQDALGKVLALKPGASLVVEKTPGHSQCVELILRYAPQVRFLHIIRDGRDAAASLVTASKGWGSSWGAPSTVARAAQMWVNHVEGARRAGAIGPYHEIRYEDLRGADAAGRLVEIFTFCGLPIDAADARRRLEEYSLARQRSGGASSVVFAGEAARHATAGAEPEGFFGPGRNGWRDSWTLRERVEFDHIAGRQLRELGYERDDTWLGPPRAVAREQRALARRARTARVVRAVGRRIDRAGERYGDKRP